MPRVEVKPEILIARFAQVPHTGPVIDTFRKFSDPATLRSSLEPRGPGQYYFGVEADPKELLFSRPRMCLRGHPEGPKICLDVYPPTIQFEIGWQLSPYNSLDNSLKESFVYFFERTTRVDATFDPLSDTGAWVLKLLEYYTKANHKYFVAQNIDPQPRVLALKEWEREEKVSHINFLKSLKDSI